MSITKCQKRTFNIAKDEPSEKENRRIGKRMYKDTEPKHTYNKKVGKEEPDSSVKTGKRMNPMRASQMFFDTSNLFF